MPYILSEIISKLDIKRDLSLFKPQSVSDLEKRIYEKNGKPYLKCPATGKEYPAKPEEVVQQLFIDQLIHVYGYPKARIDVRVKVTMGKDESKQADVIVYQEDRETPWIVAEIKEPHQKNNVSQLRSYLNAKGSPIGVALNGKDIERLFRPYPLAFTTLPDLPFEHEYQFVKDKERPAQEIREVILKRDWTLAKLKEKNENRIFDLKTLIQNLEELVLANSGADSFTEIFKLIYAKLYDESEARHRDNGQLFFRQYSDPKTTYKKISELFEDSKSQWKDIFEKSDKIKLTPEHLDVCVGDLTDIQLFQSNLRIIDEAFEYLISSVAKGSKGQYFTPRVVIDVCVKMLNPGRREYVLDPACGSAGFLVHTLRYVWNKFNMTDWQTRTEHAGRYLWGIDFDERTAKISRAIMLISGDGKSHIYQDNSLMQNRWDGRLYLDLKAENLIDENQDNRNKDLLFDVVMSNPPFAGDIQEKGIINQFEDILGYKYSCKIDYASVAQIIREFKTEYGVTFIDDAKTIIREKLKEINSSDDYNLDYMDEEERYSLVAPEIARTIIETMEEPVVHEAVVTPKLRKLIRFKISKSKFDIVERHILFIERVIDMLKPGGRAVIVLPQGIFNNTNQMYIRKYITCKARILAVVGLHGNSFKPHTGTKTSLIFLKKFAENEQPADYPIFFAVSKVPFKDNSGDYVFLKNQDGTYQRDEYGDPMYQTDLFDIADAFIEWGKNHLENGDNAFEFLKG